VTHFNYISFQQKEENFVCDTRELRLPQAFLLTFLIIISVVVKINPNML